MALTATATEKVRKDICRCLAMPGALTYKASFVRPNLTFRVVPKVTGFDPETGEPLALQRLVAYCRSKGVHASGIVYCLSRDESERVAQYLRDGGGLVAAHYHAGMSHKQRMEVRREWRRGGGGGRRGKSGGRGSWRG
jgi:bloom syndrome protein